MLFFFFFFFLLTRESRLVLRWVAYTLRGIVLNVVTDSLFRIVSTFRAIKVKCRPFSVYVRSTATNSYNTHTHSLYKSHRRDMSILMRWHFFSLFLLLNQYTTIPAYHSIYTTIYTFHIHSFIPHEVCAHFD